MKNVSTAVVNVSQDTNVVKAAVIRPVPTVFIAAEIRVNAYANLKNVPKTALGMSSDAVAFVRPDMNIAAAPVTRLAQDPA